MPVKLFISVITIKLEENGKIILPEPEPFEEEDVPPETDVYIPPHPPKRNVGNLTRGLIVETAQKVEQTQNASDTPDSNGAQDAGQMTESGSGENTQDE